MIIFFVAVLDLQGMDHNRLIEGKLNQAVKRCFYSDPYLSNGNKRPLVWAHLTQEAYGSIATVIDDECKQLNKTFPDFLDVHFFSGTKKVVKNAESDQWINYADKDITRSTMCRVYTVNGEQLDKDLDNIKQFIRQDKDTPLLVATMNNLTQNQVDCVFDALGNDVEVFGNSEELMTIKSMMIVVAIAKQIEADAEKISKALNKSQPGYFGVIKNFVRKHPWIMVSTFSMGVLLGLLYYKRSH